MKSLFIIETCKVGFFDIMLIRAYERGLEHDRPEGMETFLLDILLV